MVSFIKRLDSATADLVDMFKVLVVFSTGVLVGLVVAAYFFYF